MEQAGRVGPINNMFNLHFQYDLSKVAVKRRPISYYDHNQQVPDTEVACVIC